MFQSECGSHTLRRFICAPSVFQGVNDGTALELITTLKRQVGGARLEKAVAK